MLITHSERARSDLDNSMIPAINVVFLLLIFFMIAGQIEAQNTLLQPPLSQSEAALAAESVEIKLLGDGQRLLNEQPIDGPLLEALRALNISADTALTCLVHRELPAAALDPVLVAAKQLGIKRLQIATESLQ